MEYNSEANDSYGLVLFNESDKPISLKFMSYELFKSKRFLNGIVWDSESLSGIQFKNEWFSWADTFLWIRQKSHSQIP